MKTRQYLRDKIKKSKSPWRASNILFFNNYKNPLPQNSRIAGDKLKRTIKNKPKSQE